MFGRQASVFLEFHSSRALIPHVLSNTANATPAAYPQELPRTQGYCEKHPICATEFVNFSAAISENLKLSTTTKKLK